MFSEHFSPEKKKNLKPSPGRIVCLVGLHWLISLFFLTAIRSEHYTHTQTHTHTHTHAGREVS